MEVGACAQSSKYEEPLSRPLIQKQEMEDPGEDRPLLESVQELLAKEKLVMECQLSKRDEKIEELEKKKKNLEKKLKQVNHRVVELLTHVIYLKSATREGE